MPTAPAFWWSERRGLPAALLQPIGALYGAVTAWRMRQPGTILSVPVVCVGNLVVGGSGKTPTALAIASFLADAGHRPVFLSRGYGRATAGRDAASVLCVDPARHAAADAGDEPLLLAASAPTYVSTDRVAASRQAIADGATVLVLDDGLQNPSLAKALAVAVIDGATGCGNGLCMPAGPLRAPLAAQWPHVTAAVVIGEGRAGDVIARQAEAQGRPVLRARLEPDAEVVAALRGCALHAFAGIGRPGKFFATLEAQGLQMQARRAFPDHHRFTSDELTQLQRDARTGKATLVTTAKDRMRLPPGFPAIAVPVSLRFDDADAVHRLLRPIVSVRSAGSPVGSRQ